MQAAKIRLVVAAQMHRTAGTLSFVRGNALVTGDYPNKSFDFVVSTGLGEFLKSDQIEIFYRNVHCVLAPGGVFFTNATRYEERGEAFLKTFELLTQSRTIDQLDALLDKRPWRNFKLVRDKTGLQTYADVNSFASPGSISRDLRTTNLAFRSVSSTITRRLPKCSEIWRRENQRSETAKIETDQTGGAWIKSQAESAG
jgi:Methyltransferase domain